MTSNTESVAVAATTAGDTATTMLTDPLPSFDTIYENAIKTFRSTFKAEPNVAACAPGRVNLIGEHIDYNDGFVLPMVSYVYSLLIQHMSIFFHLLFTYLV